MILNKVKRIYDYMDNDYNRKATLFYDDCERVEFWDCVLLPLLENDVITQEEAELANNDMDLLEYFCKLSDYNPWWKR
jgi:hypothetical protein